MTNVTQYFVGFWPLLKQYSLFTIAIGACLAVAFFVDMIAHWPPLAVLGLDKVESRVRNIALLVAAAIAMSLFWYTKGASDEGARCKLQFTAAKANGVKRNTAARARARVDVTRGVRDSRDTDTAE